MLSKIAGLSRAAGIILAVVAALVTIPNLDIPTLLIVLGLVAGLGYNEDNSTRLILAGLGVSIVSSTVGQLPMVGAQLAGIAGNILLVVGGAIATVLTIRILNLVKGDLTSLTSK